MTTLANQLTLLHHITFADQYTLILQVPVVRFSPVIMPDDDIIAIRQVCFFSMKHSIIRVWIKKFLLP